MKWFEKKLPPVDTVYAWMVAGILIFGLLMLSSASGPVGYAKFQDALWFTKRQLLLGVIPGCILLFFTARIPYQKYRAMGSLFLIATIALLVSVFIPGIGAAWGTSKSWIHVGGLSLQPAEIAKLTFLLYLTAWLEKKGEEVCDAHKGFFPFLGVFGLVALLLVAQPDMGGLSIFAAIAIVLFFIAGGTLRHIAALIGGGAMAGFLLMKAAPYRAARLLVFLHPESDPQGIGYHITQALIAIGSGGIFGVGYGHSRQKFLYIPEVEGDSIFAIMGEELGFVLCVLFLVCLIAFALRGLRIARNAPDAFGRYLVVGVTTWLLAQACVNMFGMLGLMPMTGVTLPFVSYGGTSLAITLAAVGIVLNVSRQSTVATARGKR